MTRIFVEHIKLAYAGVTARTSILEISIKQIVSHIIMKQLLKSKEEK